jgi:hypothetical protein
LYLIRDQQSPHYKPVLLLSLDDRVTGTYCLQSYTESFLKVNYLFKNCDSYILLGTFHRFNFLISEKVIPEEKAQYERYALNVHGYISFRLISVLENCISVLKFN